MPADSDMLQIKVFYVHNFFKLQKYVNKVMKSAEFFPTVHFPSFVSIHSAYVTSKLFDTSAVTS